MRSLRIVISLVAFVCVLFAQQFEVASLKPSPPGAEGGSIQPAPGGRRYIATNRTLRQLLLTAYGIRPDQISGGPPWIDTARFDMNAEAEKPSNIDELHIMLRNLVQERFRLQSHSETKERSVYALSLGKNGARMTPHPGSNAGDRRIDRGFGKLSAKFTSMDYFAFGLSLILDRPVVNRTGLKGDYDFELSWMPDRPPGFPEGGRINGQGIDTSGPTIFEALEKQLGLKLEPQKALVETLVIDHAEKLVEN